MNNQIENEYNRLALEYDVRWQGYLKSTHKVALKLADFQSDDLVLDASGGTGLLAEQIGQFLDKDGNITLIDISEKMVKIARKRLGDFHNVKIFKNDVHDMFFKSESFTKVLSVSALHHYANPKKAVSEFYRILKPGGSLIIIDWCRDPLYFKIYDKLKKLTSRSHVRIYTSKELQNLLIGRGFRTNQFINWSFGSWALMGIKVTR